uniref:Putative glycolate oxidase subunit glcD n=1 Tax=Magnetococcus massalia (strain MO-1) TaxID=451514 RepID=A0A1S7LNN2_MAGMO|nr:Putative glycolate oxidase subunit glcD [Candidatus Magnetococcus massalia]
MVAEALLQRVTQQLQRALPADQVLSDLATLESYAWDNTGIRVRPDLVVLAQKRQDVIHCLKICHEHGVPVTPRTGGTGNVGGVLPLNGGVVLSLQQMNRVIEVAPDDRLVVVEPGVINGELQSQLEPYGLFWPPNPSSHRSCAIGGNLAMCAAGPNAVRYGVTRDWVMGLEAVLADGTVIHAGSRASKSVTGYDLTRLLVGSEGTLAVITQATLKLAPRPTAKRLMRVVFDSLDRAAQCVSRIMAAGEPPSALEFMDGGSLKLLRASGMEIPAAGQALLLLEVSADESRMEAESSRIATLLSEMAPLELVIAQSPEDAKEVWAARYALSPLLKKLSPKRINEDVAVPVSQLPALIMGLEKIAAEVDLPMANFGHAGNGNIHVNLLVDPTDSEQMERVPGALDSLFGLTMQLQGTLSGEHGIGSQKRDYLGWELDAPTLALQQQIKQLFDPKGILNPGKIFPQNARPNPQRK